MVYLLLNTCFCFLFWGKKDINCFLYELLFSKSIILIKNVAWYVVLWTEVILIVWLVFNLKHIPYFNALSDPSVWCPISNLFCSSSCGGFWGHFFVNVIYKQIWLCPHITFTLLIKILIEKPIFCFIPFLKKINHFHL